MRHWRATDLAAYPAALVNIELEIPDLRGIRGKLSALNSATAPPRIQRDTGDARDL